jgi:hypothetical protein
MGFWADMNDALGVPQFSTPQPLILVLEEFRPAPITHHPPLLQLSLAVSLAVAQDNA